jgi:hypothetical protein
LREVKPFCTVDKLYGADTHRAVICSFTAMKISNSMKTYSITPTYNAEAHPPNRQGAEVAIQCFLLLVCGFNTQKQLFGWLHRSPVEAGQNTSTVVLQVLKRRQKRNACPEL